MNLSEKLMSVQNSIGIHLTETELKKTIESIDNIKKHSNPPEEIFKQSCYIFLFFAALLEAVIFLVKGISSDFINNYTISLIGALSLILICLISITRVLLIQFQNLKNYIFEAVLQIGDIYVLGLTPLWGINYNAEKRKAWLVSSLLWV